MKRSPTAVGFAVLLALATAACGDDGSDGNLAAWCRLGGEINDQLEAGEPVSDQTFEEFADAAPSEVREASETASAAFKTSPEDALNDPEVQTAVEDIETYSEGNCS